jgi:hypothetical protein
MGLRLRVHKSASGHSASGREDGFVEMAPGRRTHSPRCPAPRGNAARQTLRLIMQIVHRVLLIASAVLAVMVVVLSQQNRALRETVQATRQAAAEPRAGLTVPVFEWLLSPVTPRGWGWCDRRHCPAEHWSRSRFRLHSSRQREAPAEFGGGFSDCLALRSRDYGFEIVWWKKLGGAAEKLTMLT